MPLKRRSQCLFSATFALSVFLLQLILLDMAEALTPEALVSAWRATLTALLALTMLATPFYLFYTSFSAGGAVPAPWRQAAAPHPPRRRREAVAGSRDRLCLRRCAAPPLLDRWRRREPGRQPAHRSRCVAESERGAKC